MNKGILTAADSGYFPGLKILLESLADKGYPIIVFDLGLTAEQIKWCEPYVAGFILVNLDELPVQPPEPMWQAWNKPCYIEHSPFDLTLWLDADTRVVGDLAPLFEVIEKEPLLIKNFFSNFTWPDRYWPCNSGVVGFNKADLAGPLFQEWLAQTKRPAAERADIEGWDEGTLIEAMKKVPGWNVKEIEGWNKLVRAHAAHRDPEPGDVVHHFMGSIKPWTPAGVVPVHKTFGSGGGGAISSITASNPISILCGSHGFATGDYVTIANVNSVGLANGTWIVTRVDANTFTLNGSIGGLVAGNGGGDLNATATASATIPGIVFRLQFMDYATGENVGAGWQSRIVFADRFHGGGLQTPLATADATGTTDPINSPNAVIAQFNREFPRDDLATDPQTFTFFVTNPQGQSWKFNFKPRASTTYRVYLQRPALGLARDAGLVYPANTVHVQKIEDSAAIAGAGVFVGPYDRDMNRQFAQLSCRGASVDTGPTDVDGDAIVFSRPGGRGANLRSSEVVYLTTALGRTPATTNPYIINGDTTTFNLYKKPVFPAAADHALVVRAVAGNNAIGNAVVWLTSQSDDTLLAGPISTNGKGYGVLYCLKSTAYKVKMSHADFKIRAGFDSFTTSADTKELFVVFSETTGGSEAGGHTVTLTIKDFVDLIRVRIGAAVNLPAARLANVGIAPAAWLTSDAAGQVRVSKVIPIDGFSQVAFLNVADGTYYLWISVEHFVPILGQTLVVSGTTTQDINMHYYPHNETNGEQSLLLAAYQYNDSVWWMTREGGEVNPSGVLGPVDGSTSTAGPVTPEGLAARKVGVNDVPKISSLWVPLVLVGEELYGTRKFYVARPADVANAAGIVGNQLRVQIPENQT